MDIRDLRSGSTIKSLRQPSSHLARTSSHNLHGNGRRLQERKSQLKIGAGEENRTPVCSLGSCRSAIELRPHRLRKHRDEGCDIRGSKKRRQPECCRNPHRPREASKWSRGPVRGSGSTPLGSAQAPRLHEYFPVASRATCRRPSQSPTDSHAAVITIAANGKARPPISPNPLEAQIPA